MSQTSPREAPLHLVVGVPPELDAHRFDDLVAVTSQMGVEAYLLDELSPPAQFSVAHELVDDDQAPDVLYDARTTDLGLVARRLGRTGIHQAIVHGRYSDTAKLLRNSGISTINQPLPDNPDAFHRSMLAAVRTEIHAGEDRLFVPDLRHFRAMISALYHNSNIAEPAIPRILNLYVQAGIDVSVAEQSYLQNPDNLELRYTTVLDATALGSDVRQARDVRRAMRPRRN